jgi:hypothetical protein
MYEIQWLQVLNKFLDGFIIGSGFFVALSIFAYCVDRVNKKKAIEKYSEE